MAACYLRLGNLEETVEACLIAIDLNSTSFQPYLRLASAFVKQGRATMAAATLLKGQAIPGLPAEAAASILKALEPLHQAKKACLATWQPLVDTFASQHEP